MRYGWLKPTSPDVVRRALMLKTHKGGVTTMISHVVLCTLGTEPSTPFHRPTLLCIKTQGVTHRVKSGDLLVPHGPCPVLLGNEPSM